MPYMPFVHELKRIVSGEGPLNRNGRRCHDVSYADIMGIESFQHNAVHEIPLTEYSCKAIIIDNGNRANMLVMHRTHCVHNARPLADCHQRRPSNPQETHKTPPYFFRVGTHTNSTGGGLHCRMRVCSGEFPTWIWTLFSSQQGGSGWDLTANIAGS